MSELAKALPMTAATAPLVQQLLKGLNSQNNRLLRLRFPRDDGPASPFLVNSFSASEGLSEDFRYEIDVLSANERIPMKDVLGKMVTVQLVREDGALRHFNGYVFEFRFLRNDGGVAHYRMVLSPWTAFLSHRKDNFIFHEKTVAEQTEEIFADYGALADWKTARLGNDPVMTDASQFDESDYNYLHRRWEALGWHYWYEHREDGHTLVLCGDSTQVEPIDAAGPEVPWQTRAGSDDRDGLARFSPVRQLVSTRVSTGSFDFKNPKPQHSQAPTLNQQGEVPVLEVYEYSGAYGFQNQSAGDDHSRLRMQEIEAKAKYFEGDGDHRALMPGRYFRLVDESGALLPGGDGEANDYLVISVRHVASNNYEAKDGGSQYRNELSCLRRKIPWHPGRGFNSETPKVVGLQTAIVVGPPGEELHSDDYGRVRVQYHWDREGQYDERSSAWVRVASPWAGEGMGGVSIPRAGQEVVVSFLDGNPDRPLIIGRVFNAANMPPFGMEVSGMRSKTVKGGGYNELAMHDSPGAQKLNLQAERNMDTLVKNDQSNTINANKSTNVGANHNETVGANQGVNVGANQDTSVGGNRSVTIKGNSTRSITGTSTTDVTGAVTESYHATQTRTVDGNFTDTVKGNWGSTLNGNYIGTVLGNWQNSITGTATWSVTGATTQTHAAGRSISVTGLDSRSVQGAVEDSNVGARSVDVTGALTQNVSATTTHYSAGAMTVASDAQVLIGVGGSGITIKGGSIEIVSNGSTIKVDAGGVTVNGAKINLNC